MLACIATGLAGAAAGDLAMTKSGEGLVATAVVALFIADECVARHPQSEAVTIAPHITTPVANTLILEGFFQSPNLLRGTSNS
jgi:hypothetical protein